MNACLIEKLHMFKIITLLFYIKNKNNARFEYCRSYLDIYIYIYRTYTREKWLERTVVEEK